MPKLGDWSGQRATIAKEVIQKFRIDTDKLIEKRLIELCAKTVKNAYDLRRSMPGAHNFTGNLINSIAGAVYSEGVPVYATYSLDITGREPIQVEMTDRKYYFAEDWDYSESVYKGTRTDEYWGHLHAKDFVFSYQPTCPYKEIVIAYTADYAEIVETMHNTLGARNAATQFERDMRSLARDITKKDWSIKGINVSGYSVFNH